MKDIKKVLEGAIELFLKQGDPVPEPINKEEFKGNISYRTTPERHFFLAKFSQQKHISMNKALDMIFDAGLPQLCAHV